METWTTELIGPLIGKTALITGGAEGVGLETARELARNGANVIICAEELSVGGQVVSEVRSEIQEAQINFELVNFSDLNSVKGFANEFISNNSRLDILINNLEISPIEERLTSQQNHELMFAKNYLAHFALTAKLFPLMKNNPDGRIIFQTSPEHKKGVIDFFDLDATHYYNPDKSYAQSKLALLIFSKELDRRLRETNLEVKSIAVQTSGSSLLSKLLGLKSKHPLDFASWATLFAATAPDVMSGNYYGAEITLGRRAHPVELDTPIHAKNIYAAEKLWEISEELTGVDFVIRDMSNILPFQMRGNIEPELYT